MNWKLLIWFCPTGAIRPDSGSTQPILTVSPFWADAMPALATSSDAIDRFNRCLVMTTVSDCDKCVANEGSDGTRSPCPRHSGSTPSGLVAPGTAPHLIRECLASRAGQ